MKKKKRKLEKFSIQLIDSCFLFRIKDDLGGTENVLLNMQACKFFNESFSDI